MQKRFKSDALRDEQGVVLVLAGITLAALLVVLAVVVDLGRLYNSRLAMQTAADTGSLAGVAATFIQADRLGGLNEADLKQFVEIRARAAAAQNLMLHGIEVDVNRDITPEFSLGDITEGELPTVTVDIQAQVPFLLFDMVPEKLLNLKKGPNSQMLHTTAAAERTVANIVLLLDVSHSMACPGGDTDECLCLTHVRGAESCEDTAARLGVNQKIQDLREAVTQFTSRFNQAIDRISVIPFNIAATTETNDTASGITDQKAVRFRPYDGDAVAAEHGFVRPDIENALANLEPKSNTNVSDALIRGYLESQRVSLLGNEEVSYVLFSDGAPTAARFLFSDSARKEALPANDPFGAGKYDYTHYTIYWSEDGDPTEPIAAPYAAPSPLIKTELLEIDYELPEPPGASSAACSTPSLPSDPRLYDSVYSNCLNSWEAHGPNDATYTFGGEYGSTRSFQEFWREMYYNSVIELSDYLRRKRGNVFVVGLGKPVVIGDDPYQGLQGTNLSEANFLRKDIFLSRVANDYRHAVIAREQSGQARYPEFGYNDYATYEELRDGTEPRAGKYFPALNSNQLVSLFDQVATQILLRLSR